MDDESDDIFTMECPHCGGKINAIEVEIGETKECPMCKNLMDKREDMWVCRFSLCSYHEDVEGEE